MSVPQHILDAEKKMEEAIKAAQAENTADEATLAEEAAGQEEQTETPEGPGFGEPAPDGEAKDDADVEEQLRKALHKVSVLEGKLKSLDTKELQSRLSRVESEREQYKQAADTLFAELRELKLQKESAPQKPEVADLTDEQKELYSDMIPVMTAVVNKALTEKGVEPVKASQIEDIGRQVQQVRAEVQQDKHQNAQAAFFSKIDSLVPDRESIEKSPEFAAFMEEKDWKTGLRNQELLIARGKALDAEGAVAFYREFKKSIGKDTESTKPERDPREKYLSPGKSRASAPVSRKGPLTSAEAARLIAEARALVSKGDHEGAEKINNEIIKRMAT